MQDARLVPSAAAAWLGSGLAATGAAASRSAALVLVAVLVAGVGTMLVRRSPSGAVGSAGAVALAAAAGLAAIATAGAVRDARSWAPIGEMIVVDGRVIAASTVDGAVWAEVDAVAWARGGDAPRGAASGVVGVSVPHPDELARALSPGDEVLLEGRAASGPSIRRVAVIRDATVLAREPPRGWRAAASASRTAFTEVTDELPDATRGLVRGMVTGEDEAVPGPLLRDLRVSGLAHLTAVSGAHFAIVAGAVVAIGRRARLARGPMAVAVIGSAVALAVTVDGGGSVARAVGTAVVASAALAAGRPSRALPALAAVVTVLVIAAPPLATDLGFALSVAAVGAISLVAPGLGALLGRRVHRWLAQAVAMTVAAQAACLPLLAAIDAEVGPWAVAANAVAAPFAVPVTLAGVGALVVAPVGPAFATALAQGASWAAWPVAIVARAFAEAPGGGLRWPAGLVGALVAGVAALPLAAVAFAPRIALTAHLALMAAVLVPGVLPPALGGATRGWTVAVCDVGQGDALLIRAGGSVVMIDAGPAGPAASRCLRRLGVTTVDLLVLTHDHDDHVGGTADLLDGAVLREVWLPPGPRETTVRAAHAAAAWVSDAPSAGARVAVGGVEIEVLQSGPAPRDRDGTAINDSSVTLRATADRAGADVSVLALGDLEIDGQTRLRRATAANPAALAADVVKVAHHGSAAQDPAFAAAVSARVAVVSVGEGNDYGHPAPETLLLYAALPVLRTDRCGDILLAPTPSGVGLVRPCRDDVAG